MNNKVNPISRRKFLAVSGALAGTTIIDPRSSLFAGNIGDLRQHNAKTKIALVGTGIRGTTMWGRDIIREYADNITFVGLCDKNPGRLETSRQMMGTDCPTFTDFEKMMRETRPDVLIVTTDDDTHDYFIEKGMEMGANIICEKPMAILRGQLFWPIKDRVQRLEPIFSWRRFFSLS